MNLVASKIALKSTIALLLLIATCDRGQAQVKKNTVLAELGGTGILAGVHYERKILPEFNLYAHAGIGIYGTRNALPTIPFGVNYVLPLHKQQIFLDLGATTIYSKADVRIYILVKQNANYVNTNFWNIMPSAGLRYHTKHNLVIRAQANPVVGAYYGFIPWVGFAVGKMF
jgi:hypothetical protein